MASTASNRKSAKNLLNSEFLKIHSTLRDQDWTFWCKVIGNIIFSKFFWWNEAVEAIEAPEVIEAVEVIEAAEVADGMEITQ